MPKYNFNQTNFTAGELSPRMRGRVDVARYANGAKTLKNYIILPQGGAYRRSGTRFVNEVKASANFTRLLEFEFSVTQAYIIEAGNQYFRFYKDEGRILSSKSITGAANSGTGTIRITAVAHGFATGNTVTISGVGGTTEANGTWVITYVGADTFDLNSSAFAHAYTTGGTAVAIVEVATTYTSAQLPAVQYTQSADVLYLVHTSHPPRKLSRTSHTAWTLTTIDFLDGPYLPENTTATTLAPSAATGSITITASANTFVSTDVGRLVRIKHSTTWGYAKITGYTSATQVSADVKSTFGGTGAVATWRLGAWSDTTGYPGAVCFHEERLTFAGSTSNPQTVWMSKSGDYENFAPTATDGTVGDDNAITYTIASNKVNSIRWLDSGAVELIGTAGGEWQAKPASISEPLTPTNIAVTPQTTYGSRPLRSRRIGSAVVFVQRSGRKIREMTYDFQIDGFKAVDVSLLAEHLFRQTATDYVTDICYQQEPDSVVWMALASGKLIGMTYLREQDVVGFHQHELGGSGAVEAVAAIPAPTGVEDQLWTVVKRTINGNTVRYIEFVENAFEPTSATDITPAFFVDSGLTYTGTATNTVTGLSHLEGATVSILADGSVRPTEVVTSGSVTIEGPAAATIHVGLGFNSDIELLPTEGGAASGTSQGKVKRNHVIGIRLLNTLGLSHGKDFASLVDLPFRETDDPMDAPPPLFSGDKFISADMSYVTDNTYCFRQSQPYPSTILSVMPETHVYA